MGIKYKGVCCLIFGGLSLFVSTLLFLVSLSNPSFAKTSLLVNAVPFSVLLSAPIAVVRFNLKKKFP